MSVKLISVTPDAEKMMAYVARVSNPNNQENPNYAKLLGYCIKHNHWSVFEQAFMTLELETTRGVAENQVPGIVVSHIKNFRNATLIVQCLRIRFLSQNFVVRIPRIVRILLMILILLSSKSLRSRFESTLMKQWCSINQCLIWESQRSVRVLCFPSPRPQESICLVLAGPGFIISICVLLTALRRNIWILQKGVRRSLLSSFQPVQKHLSGSK